MDNSSPFVKYFIIKTPDGGVDNILWEWYKNVCMSGVVSGWPEVPGREVGRSTKNTMCIHVVDMSEQRGEKGEICDNFVNREKRKLYFSHAVAKYCKYSNGQ